MPGLVAQLGYGTPGTDPSVTANGWTWQAATYNTLTGVNYQYAANLTVPNAGSYAYVYRYSYFGGPYTYVGTTGVFFGTPPSPGTLTVNDRIKIGSNGNFFTLQAAINASLDTNTLLLRDTIFSEDLTVNKALPYSITLKGGLTTDFTTPVGTSIVRSLRIQQGTVRVSRLTIRPGI